MTICGLHLGIHGTQTATPTLTAGVATTIGVLPFGIPIPGRGAVATGMDTIHTMEAMATVLAITMDTGTDTMQAPTVSTIHTTETMSSPQPTTPTVA